MGEHWWRTFRKTDATAIIHVDLTPHETRWADAVAWLDEIERNRWRRYLHHRPQREFALCRAAHDPDGPIRTVFSRAEREELAAAVAHEQAPSPTG